MKLRMYLIVGFVCLVALAGTGQPGTVAAAVATQQSPSFEQQLAEKYAPVAALREQEHACDRDGEGYFPAPVEIVLGNPDVTLRQEGVESVVLEGPTAQDIAGLDETHYLDFPGDPNRPGCTYETSFKLYADETGVQPTTYARVVTDRLRGKVVLQYWFWYYFNDWNNTHESDWEMVQLVFDAFSAEEALGLEPGAVGFAQHGGGELASWDDAKLGRDGDRIVVYPAAGSHGTYYGNELYIGWGENGTGFGCDNTTTPARMVPLDVVLLPDDPDPNSEFGWMLFEGRWGELKSWEYSGPYGPNAGSKWRQPVVAMENWRDTSLSVPVSNAIGPNATDLFCSISAAGSRLVTQLWNNPAAMLGVGLGTVTLIGGLFFIKRRELAEALRLYRQHLRVFLGIGAATLPIGIAFNGFAILLREIPPLDWVLKWLNDTGGARLASAATIGGLQQIAMVLLVAPPIIMAMRDIRAGRQPEVLRSFRESYRHLGVLALALLIVSVSLSGLTLLVIGIPVALWLAVRWQFFGQATLLDDVPSGPAAVRRSAQVVNGRWWQALGDSVLFQLFSLVPGPLVGMLLMLMGKAAVDFANTLSAVLFAATVPISVIGLTQAYERYRARTAPAATSAEPESEPLPGTAPA